MSSPDRPRVTPVTAVDFSISVSPIEQEQAELIKANVENLRDRILGAVGIDAMQETVKSLPMPPTYPGRYHNQGNNTWTLYFNTTQFNDEDTRQIRLRHVDGESFAEIEHGKGGIEPVRGLDAITEINSFIEANFPTEA